MAEKMRELNNGRRRKGRAGPKGELTTRPNALPSECSRIRARRKFQAKPGQNPSREIKMDSGARPFTRELVGAFGGWRNWNASFVWPAIGVTN